MKLILNIITNLLIILILTVLGLALNCNFSGVFSIGTIIYLILRKRKNTRH